eukprot:scaffold1.g5362.t1
MLGLNGATGRDARWPASPTAHGMLLSDSAFSRKASARWAAVERHVSLVECALGALLLLLSTFYLFALTERTGQLLGLLLLLSGAAGYTGAKRRSGNFVNAQLVASMVGLLMAFQLIGNTDCALAELYQRGKATEAAVAQARQAEALNSVYTRLNEMEDMLTLVQQGAAKHVELRQEQEKLRDIDMTYIRAKVGGGARARQPSRGAAAVLGVAWALAMDMVKRHAEEMMESVLKNPNITSDAINRMSEEEKAALRKRLDTADKVLERIQRHHTDPSQAVTAEEYQQLLAALTDATVDPARADHPELEQARRWWAKSELPNFKAATERQRSDVYHTLAMGDAHQAIQDLENYRRKRREQWNDQFERQLAAYQAQNAGADYLSSVPEHCVKETRGERAVIWLGASAMVLQLVAAYTALSLSFRLPAKAE